MAPHQSKISHIRSTVSAYNLTFLFLYTTAAILLIPVCHKINVYPLRVLMTKDGLNSID